MRRFATWVPAAAVLVLGVWGPGASAKAITGWQQPQAIPGSSTQYFDQSAHTVGLADNGGAVVI